MGAGRLASADPSDRPVSDRFQTHLTSSRPPDASLKAVRTALPTGLRTGLRTALRAALHASLRTGLRSAPMDEMQTIYRLSPTRFAAMAKIPLSTVYDYVRQGKISHIRKRSTSVGIS